MCGTATGPLDDATHLPAPASSAALQSYRSSAALVYGGLELAGVHMQLLHFKPLHSAGDQPVEPGSHGQPAASAQPGSLLIDGIPTLAGQEAPNAAGGGGGEGQEAPAAPEQLLPPLNTLLEAAVPLLCSLQHLVLSGCGLDAVSLERLPAVARLESLELRQCLSVGGMDGPLQALVQQAPALTSLLFTIHWAPPVMLSLYRLSRWPAYLLAHPSLRSLTLINGGEAEWDVEQTLLPTPSTAAAAEPVLEELTTDCLASIPPPLAAVTSLRSLDVAKRAEFELTADGADTLLTLPHLTSLSLPQLSEAGRQAAEQLRNARSELTIQLATA